jgi:hypothetical protein
MIRQIKYCALALVSVLTAFQAAPAFAGQYVALGGEWFNIDGDNKQSAALDAEWRGNTFFYGLLPAVGAKINTDGGIYGYVGLNYDWQFLPNWYVMPSVDFGAYRHGSSVDLGGVAEFQEGIEGGYVFDNGYRVGAKFSHSSNAGIYNHNPGEESLTVNVSFPIGY